MINTFIGLIALPQAVVPDRSPIVASLERLPTNHPLRYCAQTHRKGQETARFTKGNNRVQHFLKSLPNLTYVLCVPSLPAHHPFFS